MQTETIEQKELRLNRYIKKINNNNYYKEINK